MWFTPEGVSFLGGLLNVGVLFGFPFKPPNKGTLKKRHSFLTWWHFSSVGRFKEIPAPDQKRR